MGTEYFRDEINIGNLGFAGTDEVGRGPLAGPVVAASSILVITGNREKGFRDGIKFLELLGVGDSKKLASKKRREILGHFKNEINLKNAVVEVSGDVSLYLSIGEKSPEYIDEHNILQASLHAMRESLIFNRGFNQVNGGKCLVDGNKKFAEVSNWEICPLIKGDQKSKLIGIASIFAKEYRDHLMGQYDEIYKGYSFSQHSGYPTKMHLESIQKFGPSPIHRKTFKGVKEFFYDEKGRSI